MSREHVLSVAQRYAKAMASGDDEAMLALYAPDAKIWHNTDGVSQSAEENIRLGRWLRRRVPGISFNDVQHTLTDEGFVQRHRMKGELPQALLLDVASCLVVTVSPQGLIARVEEYLDSAALAPLRTLSGTGRGSD